MPITINVNNLSLCHKGSGGVSTATLPDVCKTPPGPVPVPYPNVSFSSDLVKGTTTVFADGGNMIANLGSEFFKSIGDEPGVAGGVISGVNMKESTWITFSFDVKMEGKNACRLTDKKFQNHMNTVDMGGLLQAVLAVMKVDLAKGCQMLFEYIELLIGKGRKGKINGVRGLEERFQDQITGKLKPGGSPVPGMGSWEGHNQQIQSQKNALKKALDEFDKKCTGNPPGGSREWADKPLPSPQDWTGPVAQSSVLGEAARTVAKGALIVGAGVALVGTVAAVLCPFDGPLLDAAGATATSSLWGMAMAL